MKSLEAASPPEFESRGNIRLYIIRHGEPVEYGVTTSPLSPVGKAQIGEATTKIFDEIGDGVVKITHSSRERTQESAKIAHERLIELSQNSSKDLRVLSPTPRDYLQTANNLDKVRESGIEIPDLVDSWATLPETELNRIGALSVSQLGDKLIAMLRRFSKMRRVLGEYPNLYFLKFTHESTFIPLQRKLIPEVKEGAEYAETLVIDFTKDGATIANKGVRKEVAI